MGIVQVIFSRSGSEVLNSYQRHSFTMKSSTVDLNSIFYLNPSESASLDYRAQVPKWSGGEERGTILMFIRSIDPQAPLNIVDVYLIMCAIPHINNPVKGPWCSPTESQCCHHSVY